MPPDPDDNQFKDYKSRDLKTGDKIDLSRFTNRVNQRGAKAEYVDPKTKWRIAPDRAGERSHGGSAWKLIDSKGRRVGTITKDGKFLRD